MHLVFDMDGVLLDSESDLSWLDRALERAVRELDLPVADPVRSQLFPISVEQLHISADEWGIEPDRLWAVRDHHYVREKLDAIRSGELAPFDDVEALSGLVDAYDLHIISNSPQVVVDAFVEHNGYDTLFDVRLGRADGDLEALHRLKPHPYMYRELEARLDGAEGMVYIGDTETDRRFADATGMDFIHLTRDGEGTATLRALPSLLD